VLDLPPSIDPGDPLAQPTRARLFRLLGELGRAATTTELAERLELHPNGVRMHLERLERGGMVARSSELRPRGRPRDLWVIAPGARPGGLAPRGYRDLARWLSRAIPPDQATLRTLEAAGRQIGRELAPREARRDETALVTALAALGFQPRIGAVDGDTLSLCLENCPYTDAAAENQAAVCTLHRGITDGLLDVLLPHARLASFEPRDPHTAGCRIEVTGIGAAGDPA
jgi:predicted ArsR family transcriptional regulator